ncbi:MULTISPECIES: TcaA NTF2-like domain-containing protein, partial [Staphylococcus]
PKAFVQYMEKPENKKRINEQLNKAQSNIDKDKQYRVDLGTITDAKDRTIIDIKKDGKKFFLIDKLAFTPHFNKVYVTENDNTGVYNYKLDGKRHTSSDKNSTSEIGQFFVGRYSINANKEIKQSLVNGQSKGKLEFDTDNTDAKNRIIANQSFDQAKFKVNLENTKLLDNNSISLVINGHKSKYSPNKIYGYYSNNDSIQVAAKGKVENKSFETDTKNIDSNGNTVNLSFKQHDISKYKEEAKKEKSKAKGFIKDYTDELNGAYKHSDYQYIERFIKSDSSVEKHMKKVVTGKAKNHYTDLKILSVEQNDNKFTVTASKKLDKTTIKSKYVLKYDKDLDEFKIIDYTDI